MLIKENTPKAILLILIGMSVFAFQDALIKYISEDVNIFLIYFTRGFFGIIFLIIFLFIKKESIIFKTHYPFFTLFR